MLRNVTAAIRLSWSCLFLNEVLSLNAQECDTLSSIASRYGVLNEVLSLNAQEFHHVNVLLLFRVSSMKS